MTHQPRCAPAAVFVSPGLFESLVVHVATGKFSLSAWLHSNEVKVRFLGAWLLAAQGFRI
jgi:hypothetical protein